MPVQDEVVPIGTVEQVTPAPEEALPAEAVEDVTPESAEVASV